MTAAAAKRWDEVCEAGACGTRRAIRAGAIAGHTSGLAEGFVQGNVAIVPAEHAPAFELYCRSNAQACPLLAVSRPGDPALPTLGEGIDIRTDLPRYRVFRDGRLAGEPAGIADLWRDDLVTFVIGCSFTFERALIDAGIPLRHVAQGRNVEEAVDRLDWEDGEILLIGSSRLARNRSIFLGSTANRILRALPVPMIVVPSDYELKSPSHSTTNDTPREAEA